MILPVMIGAVVLLTALFVVILCMPARWTGPGREPREN
jgi:hypothetical protein